jgi:membrane protein YqaA with SNARE-associated domain
MYNYISSDLPCNTLKAKFLTSGIDSFTVCAMQEFLTTHGLPALFLLSFLASTLIPLGSEWLLIALLAKGFTPMPVVLVASAGNFLGACTSYLIGIYGSSFIEEKLLRMDNTGRERAERAFRRFGSWSLLFTWLPVVGDPLCLVAGVMKVGFSRFAILVMLGKAGRYAVVAWAAIAGKPLLPDLF